MNWVNMLKRSSFAPVFKKYFQLQKRAASHSSQGWWGQWISGSRRAESLEENGDVVRRKELMWELRKGHWVRFLLHNCAGPSSHREPLWSQDCEEDDNACSIFLLLLRHTKWEFQSNTLWDHLRSHIGSSRARSNKSIGKGTLYVFRDLIPLTHGNWGNWWWKVGVLVLDIGSFCGSSSLGS